MGLKFSRWELIPGELILFVSAKTESRFGCLTAIETRTPSAHRKDFLPKWPKKRFNENGHSDYEFQQSFSTFHTIWRRQPIYPLTDKILFIPDALSYLLTGHMVTEYTIASTSQMLNPYLREFDTLCSEINHLSPDNLPYRNIRNCNRPIIRIRFAPDGNEGHFGNCRCRTWHRLCMFHTLLRTRILPTWVRGRNLVADGYRIESAGHQWRNLCSQFHQRRRQRWALSDCWKISAVCVSISSAKRIKK